MVGCPSFAATLETYGEAVALVDGDGTTLDYAALAARADAVAAELGGTRRLVVVEMTNSIASITHLFGAWRAGMAVLLTAPDADKAAALAARFDARWMLSDRGVERVAGEGTALHPDLALLLATSGTTGSSKLVRLSATNVAANAASIAQYLGITGDQRAITSLPLHYSYGLSVLTSHLSVGASLAVTDLSVIDPDFRALLTDARVTSLAGVPYTYDLMERAGFRDWAPDSVDMLTQAGGRMSGDQIARYDAWMRVRGGRLVVMYGQTEATARIAYVPPAMLADNIGCIGQAIPGGELSLIDAEGAAVTACDVEGELVYRGPNVMLGYATDAVDLARGAELDALHTGDLAMRGVNGLFRISGRKSRFVKLFGLRVSLDAVEDDVRVGGHVAAVTGDDTVVAVAVVGADNNTADTLRRELAARYRLPEAVFDVAGVADLPLLTNRKVNYRHVLNAALERREVEARVAKAHGRDGGFLPLFRDAFPTRRVTTDDSFTSLAGDSLNYVLIASEIEHRLGALPDAWEAMPVAALDARAAAAGPPATGWVIPVDSEIVLRAAAISAVVANHASDWPVGGGVDALLILVGFNLGRFQYARFMQGEFWEAVARLVPRIILPYFILLGGYALFVKPVSLSSWLLVSNFSGRFGGLLEPYWFIEAFFQSMLVMALLGSFKPVRAAASRNPFGFGLILLGAALIVKGGMPVLFDSARLSDRTPDQLFVLIALGWAVHFAQSRGERAGMLLIAAALALSHVALVRPEWWHIAGGPVRGLWTIIPVALLLYARRIPLPRAVRSVAVGLSAASFTIYMVHIIPIQVVHTRWGVEQPWLVLSTGLLGGLAVHAALPYGFRALRGLAFRHPRATSAGGNPTHD